jgi:16S rRNA (guanine527-N7)-methyltransferase
MPEGDRAAIEWLAQQASALGVPLTDEQRGQFARYLAMLLEWNERAGLTSLTDPLEVARRHLAESIAFGIALHEVGLLVEGESVLDLGSGGGFPGLPMQIAWPGLHVTLLESSARRCQFLETVVQALALPDTRVVRGRAEEVGRAPEHREAYGLAVARAVAPLAVLVEYALPLVRRGGVLAALKGSRAGEEIEEARGAIDALGGVVRGLLAVPMPPGSTEQQIVLVTRERVLDARYPRRPGVPGKRPLR